MKILPRLAIAGLTSVAAGPVLAQAPAWPSGPVTIIVPYGTGGGTDSTARALATAMSEDLGVPVTVENRTGAGGTVGMMYFQENSEPDGQTLLVGQTGLVTSVPMLNDVTYTQEDFVFLARLANPVEVLVASQEYPANNPTEFIEYSRAHPEELAMVYGAVGSQGWVGVQQIQAELGFEIPSVPLPTGGGADQSSMVAGNHAQAGVISLTAVTPFLNSGMVKPIGLLQRERSPLLPEVPTFAEAGFDVAIGDEVNLYALAETPPETLEAISAAVKAAYEDQNYLDTLANVRVVANYGDRDELTAVIAERTTVAETFLAGR